MTTDLDPERQRQARQYARIRRRLWLADQALSLLYAGLWLAAGWAVGLRTWLAGFTDSDWVLVMAFAAVFGGLYLAIELPLGYYAGFVLPRRFGQSTQRARDWVLDQLKGLAVAAPLGLVLLELTYWALRAAGDAWWLWVAAGILVVSILLTHLAPVLIMPLFNTFSPLGDEHADLAARLVALARKANTRVRGVFTMDMSRRTKAANAALTGLGNTRRIVLGDTLLKEFSPDEIESVLAHELGHHVHRDIPLLIGFGALLTTVGLYLASLGMDWAVGAFGLDGVADPAGLPALIILVSLYQLLVMPIANAFSRWRERLADDYALAATGNGQAFASAMVRLANQNLGDVEPEAWVVWLFYDHPPLGERIAKAEGWRPA